MERSKTVAAALLAVVVGIFGLSMVFSDLGPGETLASRLIAVVALFLIPGVAVGFLSARYWPMAMLIAWGATPFGALLCLSVIRRYGADAFTAPELLYLSIGLLIMLGPLGLALLGGYLGSRLSRSQKA